MGVATIEERVAALEVEVARLKQQIEVTKPSGPWWEDICGTFEDDPIYEEAMRLGREYRESLRPKPPSKRTKRAQPAKETKR